MHNEPVPQRDAAIVSPAMAYLEKIISDRANIIAAADNSQRLQLIRLARVAAAALETEFDTLQRVVFSVSALQI